MRAGLADPALARYATWDALAARLVDARAGALANRVRRLAGLVGSGPDWHAEVLSELGMLHLIAQAGRRLPSCPARWPMPSPRPRGWQVRQADVLAGVPETDDWSVIGRSDIREDRIEVRRVWLRASASGRWAMLLSFAAYRQSARRLVRGRHRSSTPTCSAIRVARCGALAGHRVRRPDAVPRPRGARRRRGVRRRSGRRSRRTVDRAAIQRR